MALPDTERFILRISCRDDIGIVASVATFLATRRLFIVESADFGDQSSGLFFMRVVFASEAPDFDAAAFRREFGSLADEWAMSWSLRSAESRPRVLIMVSKADHCLNDLLYRHRIGALGMDIPAIVSNHEDCSWLAERHEIDFHHVSPAKMGKEAAEARLFELVESLEINLVVLARYMQVLSSEACERLAGRCINIHHSFLPGFKGARPYHQAWERGVKLIGATAHYVTPDLDEGPIIAQAVEPADHADTPASLTAIGRDTEARVLSQAVKLHIEGRIFLNGDRTVVFA